MGPFRRDAKDARKTVKVSIAIAWYGNLHDGLQINPNISLDDRKVLDDQFMRRHDLAYFSDWPEGTLIAHEVDGKRYEFRLYSPAYLFPLRREDGSCVRVLRNPAIHGVSTTFQDEVEYQTYLRQCRLPHWFFTPDHLNMRHNTREYHMFGFSDEQVAQMYREAAPLEVVAEATFNSRAIEAPPATRASGQPADDVYSTSLVPNVDIINAALAAGAFVDPPYATRGLGRYMWYSAGDRAAAIALGLNTPADVTARREAGQLPRHAAPHVVWIPDRRYYNPRATPEGAGRWEFNTDDDQYEVNMNLGGAGNGLGLPDRPTAQQIWRLRRSNRADRVRAADINLIWIPEEAEQPSVDVQPHGEIDDEPSTPQRLAITQGEPDSTHVEQPESSADESPSDGHFGPFTDATNGRPGNRFDQTSKFKPQYAPIVYARQTWIIDRSRAIRGQNEPHKFQVLGVKGWREFSRMQGFDWNNTDHIDSINRWRDQAYRRHPQLPAKRTVARLDYTQAQRDWMQEQLDKRVNPDDRPVGGYKKLHEDFRKTFQSSPRQISGIGALWDRMKKEGNPVRRPRGWNMKELSAKHRELQEQAKAEKEKKAAEKAKEASKGLFGQGDWSEVVETEDEGHHSEEDDMDVDTADK